MPIQFSVVKGQSDKMRIGRCVSPACGRPFQLNQFSKKFSIQAEAGTIMCPHCGHVSQGDINSLFLTHALSEEQEADFIAKHSPATPQR
jgi:DNA-directed RNA polymerase subunit RPC12/RpoP